MFGWHFRSTDQGCKVLWILLFELAVLPDFCFKVLDDRYGLCVSKSHNIVCMRSLRSICCSHR